MDRWMEGRREGADWTGAMQAGGLQRPGRAWTRGAGGASLLLLLLSASGQGSSRSTGHLDAGAANCWPGFPAEPFS